MDWEPIKALAPYVMAVIAIASPFIAVHLSTRQFRSQKWWEEKHKAYSAIIEDLCELQYYFSVLVDAEMAGGKISDEFRETFAKDSDAARKRLMRATFQGSYIVSPETVNALDKLERGLESAWRAHTFFEIFDESYGSVRECLGIVREQARAELAPSWWRIFRA